MDVEIGTYKRMATVTIQVTAMGSQAPEGATKIGTDTETSKDIYATVEYSWVVA